MRLGEYPFHPLKGTNLQKAYGNQKIYYERHRHTYEVNPAYKNRFINQIVKPIFIYPVEYFNNSIYFQHYRTAIKVYENNKILGVGLKNYRIEVNKNEYQNLNTSIHPHQVHFEFLSELGIVGYLSMIFFFFYHFYKFRKNKLYNDNLNLSGLLFIITSLNFKIIDYI